MTVNVKAQINLGPRPGLPLQSEPELHRDDMAPRLNVIQPDRADAVEQPLGRVPYITLWAFCETSTFTSTLEKAVSDRRMSRADVTTREGGLRGAARFFAEQATPDLVVIETDLREDALFLELDALAEVCDANTKIVLVGTINDISFYRRLVERGITEYLVAPVEALSLINVVLKLFPQDKAGRLGKVVAFIGAKGGTGSSTVAQNTAWSLARDGTKVLLADLDVQFGTAALNYNIDAPVGFAEQLAEAERLDDAFFERLLYKYGPNLSVLASATPSRNTVPPILETIDRVLDQARATFPFVLLDLPHEWTPWVRRALLSADEVVVTAEPDLANLRNARTIVDLLKTARPNDVDPLLVLNRVGIAKRDEIKAEEFAAALQTQIKASFSFAPAAFSQAANAGQMIAEVSAADGRPFLQLAQVLSGKEPVQKPRSFLGWRRRP